MISWVKFLSKILLMFLMIQIVHWCFAKAGITESTESTILLCVFAAMLIVFGIRRAYKK
jgi:hypothetical protein